MIEAVIFDWFGVCAEKWIDVWQRSLKGRVNPERLRDDFFKNLDAYATSAITGEVFLGRVLGEQILNPGQHRELLTNVGAINFELLERIRGLKEGTRTALLSDNFTEIAPVIDQRIGGFANYFDVTILSNELGIGKKGPKIYQATLDRLGVPASEAVFIDDKQKNLDVARSLGIDTIQYAFTNGQGNEQLYTALRERGVEI